MEVIKQEDIDEIMDYFNFEKVERAMRLLRWEWGSGEDSHYPDQGQLRKKARELLKSACSSEDEEYFIGSGGFWVTKIGTYLQLVFAVSEANNLE